MLKDSIKKVVKKRKFLKFPMIGIWAILKLVLFVAPVAILTKILLGIKK